MKELIELKSRNLKAYVGLAMSLEECKSFVESLINSINDAQAESQEVSENEAKDKPICRNCNEAYNPISLGIMCDRCFSEQ